MPLARRIPKRGFNNIFAKPLTSVNVGLMNGFEDGAVVDVAALQAAGYNNGTGKTIPVFGVDATDAAKEKIADKSMTGTIKQDAVGMAEAISTITQNLASGKATFDGIDSASVVGTWRVNIPYSSYTGE